MPPPRRVSRWTCMATLSVLMLLVLFWIVAAALFYRLLVATLRLVGAVPVLGSIVGASSARGTDTFRFGLGRLFSWSVSVNRQRGTLTGSIQIDGARRWGSFGVLVACLAAAAVPVVAALLMPVAIVVVGLAGVESRSPTRGRDPQSSAVADHG
jgi:hypothetical protein